MKKKKTSAVLCVVASAVLWGTYGAFVTEITSLGMDRNVLNFMRFLMTEIPVLLLILARGGGELRIRREDVKWFLANGLVSVLFFTTCYTMAIQETKIATAAALLYTAPAIVMAFSVWIFREALTFGKVSCVALAIAGCALVSGLGGGISATPKGILLGLGAALGYGLYSIFSRIILDKGYSAFTNVFYAFSMATGAYFLICLLSGQIRQIFSLPAVTGLATVCGLTTGAAAYVLYTIGLTNMEASRAAQLATIEPVTAAILGVFLFHQTLSRMELLGIAMVVGAVLLMNRPQRKT